MPKKAHVPLEKRVLENRVRKYRVVADFITTAPVEYLLNNYYTSNEDRARFIMRLWRRHLQGDREVDLVSIGAERMDDLA